MFILTSVFLIIVLSTYWKHGGPVVAFAIAWIIGVIPLALSMITYRYFPVADLEYEVSLIGFLLCFIGGSLIHRSLFRKISILAPPFPIVRTSLSSARLLVKLCWWVAVFSTVCLWIDFVTKGGANLSDLAALRAEYAVKATGSSLFAQLATITSWACIYCFIFAVTYREKFKPTTFGYYALPAAGYFLGSLLSAGREAAFQIFLIVLTLITTSPRLADSSDTKLKPMRTRIYSQLSKLHGSQNAFLKNFAFAAPISSVLVAYMVYIAIARNNNQISADHTQVLRLLFSYDVSPVVEGLENILGSGFKVLIEESLTYFTSPVTLFRSFLTIDPDKHYFGVFTFPFLFRQFEPLTHVSVIGALFDKMAAVQHSGVLGAGWTTAISAYTWDFGTAGACVMLFLQGFYSEHVWLRSRTRGDFGDLVLLVLMFISAIYTPLFPASSDTGLLLLWLFVIITQTIKRISFGRRGNLIMYRIKSRGSLTVTETS